MPETVLLCLWREKGRGILGSCTAKRRDIVQLYSAYFGILSNGGVGAAVSATPRVNVKVDV